MRKNFLLQRRAVPLNVILPKGTFFAARYKRISRKNLHKKTLYKEKSKVCSGKYLGQGKKNKEKI